MNSETVWTANRKEAYEFAKLVNVCDGVNRVKVKRHDEESFDIHIVYEMWAREEICNISIMNNFEGLNFYGTKDCIGEMLSSMRRV